jgi:dTDP-4-amino-4,6-dideoxygalactose transaminase
MVGFNSRLDSFQAVILNAKLGRLTEWNKQRGAASERYNELLAAKERVRPPVVLPGNDHVWHLYVVRVPMRDEVLAMMHGDGVGVGVHYPIPMHLQGALSFLGHRQGDFPNSEAAASEMLSLPIYPGITAHQQEAVVDSLHRALDVVT